MNPQIYHRSMHQFATNPQTQISKTHKLNPQTQIYTTELRDRKMKERNLPIWERETTIHESGSVTGG